MNDRTLETSPDLDLLEDEFDDYAAECEDALGIVLARIRSAQRAIERSEKRNIICFIEDRIKSFPSVIDKCDRREYPMNIDSIRANVRDIGGIRIVTPFRDDIYSVVMILHHIPGINIIDETDYVANAKGNGYQSYHMHIMVEIYSPIANSTKLIPIEIQIRDKAMDLWSSIEHIIKYKKDVHDPRVSEYFKQIAVNLVKFDDIAIELRDYAENHEDHTED